MPNKIIWYAKNKHVTNVSKFMTLYVKLIYFMYAKGNLTSNTRSYVTISSFTHYTAEHRPLRNNPKNKGIIRSFRSIHAMLARVFLLVATVTVAPLTVVDFYDTHRPCWGGDTLYP